MSEDSARSRPEDELVGNCWPKNAPGSWTGVSDDELRVGAERLLAPAV
jgi:hypothetical protein